MNNQLMRLKILLPNKVLADVTAVQSMVAETTEGSLGLLPHRLDCVAILKAGIFTYEVDGRENYVAVDVGTLVKAGLDVSVSVRDALAGVGLDQLRAEVEKKFVNLDEEERQMRSALAKIEGGFMRRLQEIKHER